MRETIIDDLLRLRGEGRRGVTFLGARERRRVPYGELIDSALRFAAGLRACGLRPGEPVVLVLDRPEEALLAILGGMLAGNPPAPIYPPVGVAAVPSALRYLDHVAARAGAAHVVAGARIVPFLGAARSRVHRFAAVMESAADAAARPAPSDTAFLQFTSGSTAAPKGVIVTHGCLRANLEMIRAAARMDERSCVVTWLPVYHDMGLIGTVLNALTMPIELSVLSPLTFLRQPRLWLEEISRARGSHTAAPNFAYGLCVKRVPDVSGLDLSAMRVFICGAEPIVPETLERFAAHYASGGLDAGAITPAYGLAEATLAVTFTPYLRGLRCDAVDAEALGREHVARSAPSGNALRVSGCGVAMPGLELRVADAAGRALGERAVGEIQVRGPSVTPGYVNDPESSAAARTPDGWLRTGDLGYLAGGELHPCGRSKDLIILRGRNLHAHDVEAVAGALPRVRTGNVAAFGVDGREGERLVVVAESHQPERAGEIERAIRAELSAALGVVPDDVRVVPPGTLPKTSSGKLKRAEARERYLAGTLARTRNTGEWLAAVVRSGIGHVTGSLTRADVR